MGVTGRPVLHSRSPAMFRAAFEALGMEARYVRVAADDAAEALALARALGLRGLNVTSPFKEEMAGRVDELDERASKVGSVNAVVLGQGRTRGCNTDVDGVAQALAAHGCEPASQRALVIGAGGAGRAAAFALQSLGAGDVAITTRDRQRGALAARDLGCRFVPWERAGGESRGSTLIVGCLPRGAGLPRALELAPGTRFLDANVGVREPLCAAIEAGCVCANGLTWLAAQGAASLELFTGLAASLPIMREAAARDDAGAGARRVALVGASGAGKTTVGTGLARMLGWQFVDTDRMVERAAGASVARIFEAEGEEGFRARESLAAQEALRIPDAVVALGAGALGCGGTRGLVRERCLGVWLWVDPARGARRAADGSRPLLAGADPGAVARRLAEARRDGWLAVADLVIDCSQRTAEEAARRIADEIGSSGDR
jgi:shikimate dehydrogenase